MIYKTLPRHWTQRNQQQIQWVAGLKTWIWDCQITSQGPLATLPEYELNTQNSLITFTLIATFCSSRSPFLLHKSYTAFFTFDATCLVFTFASELWVLCSLNTFISMAITHTNSPNWNILYWVEILQTKQMNLRWISIRW